MNLTTTTAAVSPLRVRPSTAGANRPRVMATMRRSEQLEPAWFSGHRTSHDPTLQRTKLRGGRRRPQPGALLQPPPSLGSGPHRPASKQRPGKNTGGTRSALDLVNVHGEPRPNGPVATGLCLSTGQPAEVAMTWATDMQEKVVAEYRTAKAQGAAWLWKRAIRRAGGSRTVRMIIFRLWANHTTRAQRRAERAQNLVDTLQGKRVQPCFRAWQRFAKESHKQRQRDTISERELALRASNKAVKQLERQVQQLQEQLQAKNDQVDVLHEELNKCKAQMAEGLAFRLRMRLKEQVARAETAEHCCAQWQALATDLFEQTATVVEDRLTGLTLAHGRNDGFRHVLSERTKELLRLERPTAPTEDNPLPRTSYLSSLGTWDHRCKKASDYVKPASKPDAAAEGDLAEGDGDGGGTSGPRKTSRKRSAAVTGQAYAKQAGQSRFLPERWASTMYSPANLAELVLLDWINFYSKRLGDRVAVDESEVGKLLQAALGDFHNVTDFSGSLQDGMAIGRVLFCCLDGLVERTHSLDAAESVAGVQTDRLHPYTRADSAVMDRLLASLTEHQHSKELFAKDIVALLHETFRLPESALFDVDIFAKDRNWAFVTWSFLMLTAPVERDSAVQCRVLQHSQELARLRTSWADVASGGPTEAGEEPRSQHLDEAAAREAEEEDEWSSPVRDFDQLRAVSGALHPVVKSIRQMESDVGEGQALWEMSTRVVVEKAIAELASRARRPNGFLGSVEAFAHEKGARRNARRNALVH